jgi:hypothetical protein
MKSQFDDFTSHIIGDMAKITDSAGAKQAGWEMVGKENTGDFLMRRRVKIVENQHMNEADNKRQHAGEEGWYYKGVRTAPYVQTDDGAKLTLVEGEFIFL